MKYGVVSVADMLTDLREWSTLYVAGRFHKPVTVFRGSEDQQFVSAARLNHTTGLAAGLLLLPEHFSLRQLLVAVAGLSYTGDFRMVFGENPLKVTNIVDGQFGELARLYWPMLLATPSVHVPSAVASLPPSELWPSLLLSQDTSAEARLAVVAALPEWLRRGMALRARDGLEAPALQQHPTVPRAAFAAAASAARYATGSLASRAPAAPAAAATFGAASALTSWLAPHASPGHLGADSEGSSPGRRVTAGRAVLGMAGMAARTAAVAARQPLYQKRSPDLMAAFRRSGSRSDMPARLLRPTLAARVAQHAVSQSIKGILSAGPSKTASYSAAKLRKWASAVKRPGARSSAAITLLAVGIAALLPRA